MTVATFDPSAKPSQPDAQRVSNWAAESWSSAADLARLDDLDKQSIQQWISLDWHAWEPVLTHLTAQQLCHFMQLMTLAESHLGGCDAGAKSAVIHAFRQHKSAFGSPDKELVRWIKANTENRFLPYGPVL